ncbi:HAMP domain-containing sensor histidine kinase [Tardiphaga sp. P9-11]|uniref:sensor histidine kinase n=1 Tax=Tardiphaga sp. P9-11 TaxID=2024614 RepID=UPI001FEE6A51|nr:HAMP domain-containing sensor histidine kinase [Tardiphaga sp. P9-11]
MTATEALAQAEAARLSLARIMAVAGHDLKQPLQIAVMSIERAMSDTLGQVAQRRLSMALDALCRLDTELSELARSSQIDRSSDQSIEKVALGTLLSDLEDDWFEYASSRDIAFYVEPSALDVRSNQAMLRTILRNLVGNAIKFSPSGSCVGVNCRIGVNEVTIEISDEGCGIPELELSRIFEVFARGERSHHTCGLGLGLYIVRETADILKHPVTVRSIQGEGSTFSVTIPLMEN